MCKCTPDVRTPFCGKPGCEWPEDVPLACRGEWVVLNENWLGFRVIMQPDKTLPPGTVEVWQDGKRMYHCRLTAVSENKP